MFLATTALSSSITSGSFAIGNLVNVSDYKQLWVEMACSGTIAGTGSLYLTSISQKDINPLNGNPTAPEFGIQSGPVQTLSIDGSSGWVALSASILPIDAHWGVYAFQETSGSASGTGSVVVKWSLLT